jgi:hypothetical protein
MGCTIRRKLPHSSGGKISPLIPSSNTWDGPNWGYSRESGTLLPALPLSRPGIYITLNAKTGAVTRQGKDPENPFD